jgi:hypothetical protein
MRDPAKICAIQTRDIESPATHHLFNQGPCLGRAKAGLSPSKRLGGERGPGRERERGRARGL